MNVKPIILSLLIITGLSFLSVASAQTLNDLTTFSKNGHIVNALAFSPDNKILATGGTDANIVLWDLNSYREMRTLKGHIAPVEALEFDFETGWLYSVGRDNKLIAWNIKTGKIEFNIKAHEREARDLRIDYFRGNIITASADKTISLWDKSTGEHQKTFYGHERDVTSISISSDWNFLFSSGPDLMLKTWDLNNGAELKSINVGRSWIYALSRSPVNNVYASGGDNKVIQVWNDNVYSPIRTIEGQKGKITALDISGNGKLLASGSYDKTVFIYEIESGKLLAETEKHKAAIKDVKFSWDGQLLATAVVGTNIRLFEVNSLGAGEFAMNIPKRDGSRVIASSSLGTATTTTKSSTVNTSRTETINDDVSFNPLEVGENHLLLIAINDYEHWPRLNNAMNDANDVKSLLTDQYQFKDENVYMVSNDEATLENIHNAFQDLRAKVGEKDNLLIFYSGHGYYDKDLDEGYWVPVDAESGKTTDYLPNSNLLKYIKALKSKHIFLVADACFSGSLFSPSTRGYVENVEKYRSRWALTSGRLEYVSDGNYGQRNSPFTSYFLKYLETNDKEEVPVSEVIQYVKVAVSNNSDQTPIGSPLKNVGDEGGEFIFRKE
jgi:WD40 repeat protein